MENRRGKRRPRPPQPPSPVATASSSGSTTSKRSTSSSVTATATAPTTRARTSSSRLTSPGRTRSPVRRSSRSRSTAVGAGQTSAATVVPPSPVQEAKEPTSPRSPVISYSEGSLSSAAASTTSLGVPILTSSLYSSYSATTQRTIEVMPSADATDFMRRSLSRSIGGGRREGSATPTTNTEAESRYSRSMSRSIYEEDRYSKAEFSDNETHELLKRVVPQEDIEEDGEDDEEENYKSFNVSEPFPSVGFCRQLPVPQEFGGWIGALLLIVILPSVVYYLQWSCMRSGCHFKPLNVTNILDANYLMERVFKPDVVGAYVSFVIGIFFLSAVLPGRTVRLPAERGTSGVYEFNALVLSVVVTVAFGVAEYCGYGVAQYVIRNYLRLCIYGFLNACIVAQWSYIRTYWAKRLSNEPISEQINLYGTSGNPVIDYALGRQINPKWLGFVDLKQVFYRISLISTLILVECFIYKNIQIPGDLPPSLSRQGALLPIAQYYLTNLKYDPAALLASSLVLLYIMDAIIFEHHLASSFELQGEGFGCLLLLRYAATPYLLCGVAKYFFDRRIPITCKWAIYVALLVLLTGLFLKRLSSAIKYKYRIDPQHLHFVNVESIHTFQGRRLLLGGLWGRLRQPNYAGDIIALIGLVVPLFLRFSWPPLVGILICIAILLHRAVRVNARNLARYHSSWVRYCSMVRNYVVPKVF